MLLIGWTSIIGYCFLNISITQYFMSWFSNDYKSHNLGFRFRKFTTKCLLPSSLITQRDKDSG